MLFRSATNGMETPLSIFFFGAFLYSVSRASVTDDGPAALPRQLALLGLCLAGMTISRLDDVFLPFSIVSVLFASRKYRYDFLRLGSYLLLPVSFLILAYLTFNILTFGHPFPVSMLIKQGHGLMVNIRLTWEYIHELFGWSFEETTGIYRASAVRWRLEHAFYPAIVSSVFLLFGASRPEKCARFLGLTEFQLRLLQGVSVYVFVKAGYTLLSTQMNDIGNWYFSVSILFANFLFSLFLGGLLSRSKRLTAWPSQLVLAAAYASVVAVTVFPDVVSNTQRPNRYYDLWAQRERLNASLESSGVKKVVEFDDGICAFSLNVSAISGWGFCADYRTYRAIRDGRFFEHVYDRGHDAIITLDGLSRLKGVTSHEELATYARSATNLKFAKSQDVSKFDFFVTYQDPETGLMVISFAPKKTATS